MDLLLPVVENTSLGVNCADGAGMTGLMAALEKGRLEVVDRLLDHKDINMDFTQTDARGRSTLDLVILSPSDHFMDLVLDGLMANLVEGEELEKMLLPRLLSCVSLGEVDKFKKMMECFDVDFQEGALLSFLIVSGILGVCKPKSLGKQIENTTFQVQNLTPQVRPSSSEFWPITAWMRRTRSLSRTGEVFCML